MEIIDVLRDELPENEKDYTEDLKLIKVQYFKSRETLVLVMKSKNSISDMVRHKIVDIYKKYFNRLCNVELKLYKDISSVTLTEAIQEYWEEIIKATEEIDPLVKQCLSKCSRVAEEDVLTLKYGNAFICKFLKNKGLEKRLSQEINSIFGLQCAVNLQFDKELERQCIIEEQENIDKSIKNIAIKKEAKSNVSNSLPKTSSQGKEQSSSVIFGKSIKEESVPIKDIPMEEGIICVEGEIFKLEIKETKTSKKFFVFSITDNTGSLIGKVFTNNSNVEKLEDNFKVGTHCKIKGQLKEDLFAKELVIMANSICLTTKIEKLDLCDEKRVELHLHTTMSAMDGMTSASKLISRAAKWGHRAIAITDHGVAQAFPEAMDSGKKNNIKILYGMEAYMVDDDSKIAINTDCEDFKCEFVVFDIRKTGNCYKKDKIIEISACKVKEGKIVDVFQKLINPEMEIPYNICEDTKITNDMVLNCEPLEHVFKEFIEFCKGAILTSYDIELSMAFINYNCELLGLKINNGYLDILHMCRYLVSGVKKFKLTVVAKHFGILCDNIHRAEDSVKVMTQIFLNCISMLKERNIENLEELNNRYKEEFDVKKADTYHLIILCKNQQGLRNLYELISASNLDFYNKRPRLSKSLINKKREGLIIGSACEAGQVFRKVLFGKKYEDMVELLKFYDYLEIQPIGNNNFLKQKGYCKNDEDLRDLNREIYHISKLQGLPVVATGDVHFLDPEDEVYRRILMAGQGFTDSDNQPPLYFKTTEEMLKEFSYLGEDVAREVVVTNTNLIADSIENIKPIPDETFPPKIEGAEEDIRNMTLNKVHSIYGEELPDVIQKRLDKELNSIINNGYAVLYLIAQKLVAKSTQDGYLVGSRGSVGSSFVATMSDITEVNGLPPHYVCPNCKFSEFVLDGSVGSGVDMPDKMCPHCGTQFKKDGFDIPFETFLGFNGDKEPDIDLNFSGDNQGDIHKYTEVLFGKGHTFKAGTIGTIAEKTAYGYVRKYLEERNLKVSSAEIDRLTLGCTGVKRTTGQHPGGIMVVPSDNNIHNFCPVQHPADDQNSDIITTHFDYHSISGRLLKLDILGHDDPTILRMLKDITKIDPKTVPLDDKDVLSLFTSPKALGLTKEQLGCEVGTYGLPEFGTKFVRQMLLDTKPETFSDLVRISGLSHGTDVWINNAQYYITQGYTTLKDCIATRDDIMVYLIYKGLPPKTAFSIMEKVRKGKGLSEEHEQIMRDNNVPEWYIESCKKIKYMFPKGHAVAYVMMAIRIAYFKVHYPHAYYATYFTVRGDDFDGELIIKGDDAVVEKMKELYDQGNEISTKDKGLLTILELCHEMYLRGIKFLRADIYKSSAKKFTVEGDNIRLALSALSGVGVNAAQNIEENRKNGEFISKEDLRVRCKLTKTVIETLDRHGCLNNLQETNQLCLF
ncbi:DNA polymerase-3 subunit alpha [Hathewaya proteolytica DSM 3090]|uniref:DNA polymerase III PolC-type n=1 Tax=Hathewaya proteolytica DSM 3090 TaxID=1121331 RepID=A0A1M6J625_9CLOT|nr:DNA polymerase-3 subunit alpha [Hathewaya proteolytica DSM 3090]